MSSGSGGGYLYISSTCLHDTCAPKPLLSATASLTFSRTSTVLVKKPTIRNVLRPFSVDSTRQLERGSHDIAGGQNTALGCCSSCSPLAVSTRPLKITFCLILEVILEEIPHSPVSKDQTASVSPDSAPLTTSCLHARPANLIRNRITGNVSCFKLHHSRLHRAGQGKSLHRGHPRSVDVAPVFDVADSERIPFERHPL
jgi:hypothetical protein